MNRQKLIFVLIFFLSAFLRSHSLIAQEEQPKPKPTDQLSQQQSQLADKYKHLEMMMLKMAEVDGAENPRRAALLKKALTQSKNKHIRLQMETLAQVISQAKLRRAIKDQTQVHVDLKLILQLLESENRADRLKNEQGRIKQYIRELQRILRQHKSVQGRTEGGENTSRLSREQEKVAGRTNKLAKLMDQNESAGNTNPNGSEKNQDETKDAKSGQGSQDNPSEQPGNNESSNDKRDKKDVPEEGANVTVATNDGRIIKGKVTKADNDSITVQTEDGKETEIATSEIDDISLDGDEKKDKTDGKSDEPTEKESSDGKPSDGKPSDGKPSDGKPSDGKPSDGKPSDGKPSDGKPSDGKPSESQPGQPSSNPNSQPGQQSQGSPGNQDQPNDQEQQESFPGRKRIAAAEERMRQAQQRLEDAKRKEAIQEQEEARRLLEQAKAELEEILRQLREEEVERTLAQLESRFRKMLEMQINVLDDTVRLGKVAVEKRNQAFEIQAGKLSLSERRIVDEADRAILLLTEEGSSVAFPEATQQIRDDMEQVAELLSQSKVGDFTQDIEKEIITALEEMVEALQKAQKDNEEQRQQRQQNRQQPGQPQDQPLVDAIAELKMIRALQMRINNRTTTFARLLVDIDDPAGQLNDEELIQSMRNLSNREEKVRRITRDIVLGKNR